MSKDLPPAGRSGRLVRRAPGEVADVQDGSVSPGDPSTRLGADAPHWLRMTERGVSLAFGVRRLVVDGALDALDLGLGVIDLDADQVERMAS